MHLTLNIELTEVQEYVFFTSKARFCVYPKGGRAGMTHGAAQSLVAIALEGRKRILWGDVQQGNTVRYIEQFMMPILNQLPKSVWKWSKGLNRINIGNSFIDFRFMANPSSWEGQGYELIYINEAGIVLKNNYIWEQVILKSMLDAGPDARCIIGGVPKGSTNHFATLIETAKNRVQAGDTDWDFKQITTYDNPFIDKKLIDKMVQDNPEVARQEVFGEVVGSDEHPFQAIPNSWVKLSMAEHKHRSAELMQVPVSVAAIDPSLGNDETVYGFKRGILVEPLLAFRGAEVSDGAKSAKKFWEILLSKCGPERAKVVPIHIDYPGIGDSVHSRLKQVNSNTVKIMGNARVNERSADRVYVINDEKTWMVWRLREALDPSNPARIILPEDPVLERQLACYHYQVYPGNILRINTKDEQKKMLNGKSPDRADAVIYLNAPFRYGKSKISTYVADF